MRCVRDASHRTAHLLAVGRAREAVGGRRIDLPRDRAHAVRQHAADGDDAREEELGDLDEVADPRLDDPLDLGERPRLGGGDVGAELGVALEPELLELGGVHGGGLDLEL